MAAVKAVQPNLLEGRLFPKIIAFVLPLMLTNLLQTLYNAADMVIVGMSGVEGALGAIGTTGSMINLIVNIFIGFSVGANVIVARSIGAGNEDATRKAVHTSMVVAGAFGILSFVIGQTVCRPLLILLGDEGRILELAVLYCRIYFIGAPFSAVTNFAIAIFRAKGDTKTPLYVLSVSGALNVGLNLLFVKVCHMSVDGVALATAIANAVSAVALVWKLCRDTGWCRLRLRDLKIHWQSFCGLIHVGIPASIQSALFSISNMLIASSIVRINNRMYPGGSAVIDGNTAGGNLESFANTLCNAVYQASVTFTSQHYGAGMYKRIGKVRGNCYLISTMVAVFVAAIALGLQKPLLGLYVQDPNALAVGALRNNIMLSGYFLLAVMEIGSGVLRGMGKSVTSAVIALLGACVFRVIWIFTIFEAHPTLECIYMSYPISWALTALTHFVVGQVVWSKLKKKEVSLA